MQKVVNIKNRRAVDKSHRRSEIMQAAKEVFASKGYHATAVSDIAELAGVAKGTFYLYFKDKETVFAELIDDLFSQIVKTWTLVEPESVKSADDMLRLTRASAVGYARLFANNREVAKMFLTEGFSTGSAIDQRRNAHNKALVETSTRFLKHGIEMGFLRKMDPVVITHCIIGSVERLTLEWLLDETLPPIEEMVEEVINLHIYGILETQVEKK